MVNYSDFGSDSSGSTGSSSSGDYENVEVRLSPYTTIECEHDRVFGTESQFGQSLGVVRSNIELFDGAFYYYPDKDRFKVVSWKQLLGLEWGEVIEEGLDVDATDADDTRVESFSNSQQRYKLVAARVPQVEDDDGDVVIEPSSRRRSIDHDEDDYELGEWEELDGETIPLPTAITWYNGSDEYGPSSTAKTLFEVLTTYGNDSLVDEDDLFNWLPDTSGQDILRDDLEGRRVEFFTITRESENGYTYNYPIVQDAKTGERVRPTNWDTDENSGGDGDSGNAQSGAESDAVAKAREKDAGSYPEPIADFISSGSNLNMNRERAEKLLDELLSDADNSMTEAMIEDNGGRDEIIEQVI